MNVSALSRNIGIILLVNAAFMLISLSVSLACGVDSSFSPLLLSAIITGVVGLFPIIFVKKSASLNRKDGFFFAVIAWIVSCIFGMLPYVLWGGEFTLVNAWFESVSGYTTTGSTILNDVEALPQGLLLWRSSTHFMGGLGIVVFMLLFLPSVGTSRMKLSRIEISDLSKENFNFRTTRMLKVILTVYTTLAAMETFALMLAGMDFLEAVNHSFSTVATGGFSTRNASVAAFDSVSVEIIIIVFMFLSSLHFGLLYSLIANRTLKLFRSPVVKFYFFTTVVTSLLIALNLTFGNVFDDFWTALRHSLFQVVSISSTTGFASADSSVWPSFSIVIILYLTIQCACSGSTCGGIKVDRIYIILMSVKSELRKRLHTNAVIPVRVGGHVVESETVSSVSQFIVLYFIVIFIGTVLVSIFEPSLIDSFTSVVASISNTGPGFGSIGSMANYGHLTAPTKMILSVIMLFGRLEIYSFLVIFLLFKKSA